MLNTLKNKLKQLLKWVWRKEMILPAILGELLFWSPLIVTAVLAILIDPWYWTAFGAIYTFWVWILPAIPIQIAFIAFFAWLFRVKTKEEHNEKTSEN